MPTPLGLPYPDPDDPVSLGASDIRALAEAVDPKLGYVRLASTLLAADAPSIDFAAIPAIYSALRLLVSARSAGTDGYLVARFNGATVGYHYEQLRIFGAGVNAQEFFNQAEAGLGTGPHSGSVAGHFGSFAVELLDYASTTKHKAYRSDYSSRPGAGAGGTELGSVGGLWENLAAINRITLSMYTAGHDLAAGTRATLFGLR